VARPSTVPGLIEYKKVIEPVKIRIDPATATVSVTNGYDLLDTAHLRFEWRLEDCGEPAADSAFDVPVTAAGAEVVVNWPEALAKAVASSTQGELWLTVSAHLAADNRWSVAGLEVAWGQKQLSAPAAPKHRGPLAEPVAAAEPRGHGCRLTPPGRQICMIFYRDERCVKDSSAQNLA
jgi:beta-galactosidase